MRHAANALKAWRRAAGLVPWRRELAWQAATLPAALATWTLAYTLAGPDAPDPGLPAWRLWSALAVVFLGAAAGPRHLLPALALPAASLGLASVWPFTPCPGPGNPDAFCEGYGLGLAGLFLYGVAAAWAGCAVGALLRWTWRTWTPHAEDAPNP